MARETRKNGITAKDLGLSRPVELGKSPVGFATAIRVLLQNWRQGTVACKGRSDVNKTNKKPWKQKGTGRARCGAASSPIWRGGGISFGPQPRTRKLKLSRKSNQKVFQQLLWHRIDTDAIVALEVTWQGDAPKTKVAREALAQAGLQGAKVTLFVSPHDYQVQASFANMDNVRVLLFDQPNVYALSHGTHWVFLRRDEQMFKDMVSAWN